MLAHAISSIRPAAPPVTPSRPHPQSLDVSASITGNVTRSRYLAVITGVACILSGSHALLTALLLAVRRAWAHATGA